MKVTQEMVLLVLNKRIGRLKNLIDSFPCSVFLGDIERRTNEISEVVNDMKNMINDFKKEQAEGKDE